MIGELIDFLNWRCNTNNMLNSCNWCDHVSGGHPPMTNTDPIHDHPPDGRILRAVARASFSLLDDRPVLFSEAAQKLYELNDLAAYIWCCLLEHRPAETICDDLTKFGLERGEARKYLSQALQGWFALGL